MIQNLGRKEAEFCFELHEEFFGDRIWAKVKVILLAPIKFALKIFEHFLDKL